MDNPRDLHKDINVNDQMTDGIDSRYRVTNKLVANEIYLCDQVWSEPPSARKSVFGDASRLRCPDCGDVHTHVQGVYTTLGGGESVGLYRGSHLIARRTNEDRDGLAVRVRCENGHWWDIVFQQRNGTTYVEFAMLAKALGVPA